MRLPAKAPPLAGADLALQLSKSLWSCADTIEASQSWLGIGLEIVQLLRLKRCGTALLEAFVAAIQPDVPQCAPFALTAIAQYSLPRFSWRTRMLSDDLPASLAYRNKAAGIAELRAMLKITQPVYFPWRALGTHKARVAPVMPLIFLVVPN